WYKFDTITTNGMPIIENNNGLTNLYGSNISYNNSIFVKGSNSISFNGTSSYLFRPPIAYNSQSYISISLWFNLNNSSLGTIISTKNISTSSYIFNVYLFNNYLTITGRNILDINTSSIVVKNNVNFTFQNNTWYHLCILINFSGNTKVYVNNQVYLDEISQDPLYVQQQLIYNTDFYIGAVVNHGSPDTLNYYLNGYIDDLRIIERELTTDEITELYNGRVSIINKYNIINNEFNNSKYIGINTNVPNSLLHLHNTAASGEVRLSLTDGNSGVATTDGFAIIKDANENCRIWNYENTSLSLGTSNTERLTIASSGLISTNNNNINAGTGTVTAATFSGSLSNNANLSILTSTANDIIFYTNTSNERLRITSNGDINHNININTTDYSIIDIQPNGWYKFDSSGNIGLDSISSYNFTNVGASSVSYNTSIFQKGTGSAYFDGNCHLSGTGINLDSKSFSISFWIYATSHTMVNFSPVKNIYCTGGNLVNLNTKTYLQLALDLNNNKFRFGFTGFSVQLLSTSLITNDLNKWVFYTCVYDNSSSVLQIYKNGVFDNSTSVTAGNYISSSTTYTIGMGNVDTNSRFIGYLDDFRIFADSALTSSQVFNLFNTTIPSFNLNTNYTS
ncbi:MAG: hypothetical protein EBU80_11535, partial [Chitinophagia bacterium]|nr:hypothetical protein [Chitinophagia bacterium]